MRSHLSHSFTLLVALLVLCTTSAGTIPCAQAQDTKPPMVISYPVYAPFCYQNQQGHMEGFFYEIVSTALAKLGIPAEWKSCPWNRCQDNVRHDDSDAIITVPTPDRARYTNTHKDPFYTKYMKVFTYTGHPQRDTILSITSLEDIKKNKLKVITYLGNSWNRENVIKLDIQTYETASLINVWKMLAAQRGDIVIEWPYAAWNHIEQAGLGPLIEETDTALAAMPFHLLISKQSRYADILDQFNSTILSMKKDGQIDEIISRYTPHQSSTPSQTKKGSSLTD